MVPRLHGVRYTLLHQHCSDGQPACKDLRSLQTARGNMTEHTV